MSTISIMGIGDMGSAVGKTLIDCGHRVITNLSGRSENSQRLAQHAGVEDGGSLESLVVESDIFLSIMPPATAKEFAQQLFPLIRDNNSALLYVDCNAVSPQTVQDIGTLAATNSVRLQDVGIIGLGPRPDRIPVRFYTSGPWLADMQSVATPLIEIMPLGAEIGRASAIKMAYASLTKGTNALRTAALLLGEQLGVRAELSAELEYSQAAVFRAMEHIPLLAADAERWGGEMQQIAATYRDAGLTTGFHEAAQWVFELLAATPMAQETRATVDGERGLEETIRILADTLTTMR